MIFTCIVLSYNVLFLMNASEVYTQNIPICGKHIYISHTMYIRILLKFSTFFSRMKTIPQSPEFPHL